MPRLPQRLPPTTTIRSNDDDGSRPDTRHRACLALSLSLLSAACSGAPPDVAGGAKRAEAPAPHLRSIAADDVRSEHPPAPEPDTSTNSVSLGSILSYADQHSPVLSVARSTRSRVEAARAAAGPRLPSNPELSIAAGPRLGRGDTGLDLDVSLMQAVEIGGERGSRLEAVERLRELTDAEIEQLRWLVHCDVHAAFHVALIEQERARLAERVVVFQEEVLNLAERQIAAGETAPLTLRLARAEVAQARQVLLAANQAFLVSRLRLAQLSGWPVATPPSPSGAVDPPWDPPPLEQLLSVAREHRPSLRVGAAKLREAEARIDVADREATTRPAFGVQYRREGAVADEGIAHVVMGAVSLPLTSFQTNAGERARARSDRNLAEAELDAARRLLDGQIAEARSQVAAAALRTRAYGSEIVPRFEENLTLLRRSFELGEIDLLALSTGRERFLQIQSDALSAQLDYFVALAGLERVVGVDLWHDDHHEEPHP